jgi:LCP family protein required for cell wall assembly
MRRQSPVIWVILLIACGGLFLSLAVIYKWNQPLISRSDLPAITPNPVAAATTVAGSPVAIDIDSAPIATAAPTQGTETSLQVTTQPPTPEATRLPLCNGPVKMTILAIGSDQRGTSYQYGLADSIYVVYIDFTVPKVMIIDFPRDLWVEIPGISDHYGLTHGKINQAYLFGNPGMGYYDGPDAGPGLLAETLQHNFGLQVDHYLAIDMQTFEKFVDTVGGVDVEIESPLDLNYGMGAPDPELYLSAGIHHLDGDLALLLATNRVPTTFQRIKYQRIILSAMREKLLKPEMIPQVPGLVARFLTSVRTDLSLLDINRLICIAQKITKENTQADSFPQEIFTADVTYDQYRKVSTFIYTADFNQIRTMVADFMNGTWPFK